MYWRKKRGKAGMYHRKCDCTIVGVCDWVVVSLLCFPNCTGHYCGRNNTLIFILWLILIELCKNTNCTGTGITELGCNRSKIVLAFSLVLDFFLLPQEILKPQKAAWKTFILYFKRNHCFKNKCWGKKPQCFISTANDDIKLGWGNETWKFTLDCKSVLLHKC